MSKNDRRHKIKELEERFNMLAKKPAGFDQLLAARRCQLANQLLHEAYNLYGRRSGHEEEEALWHKTVVLFKQTVQDAYPAHFWQNFESLKRGNFSALDTAITFLERDPWFFGSGYVKEDLITLVCKAPLSMSDSRRLQKVVLSAIELRYRREFRRYCKLARKVSSEDFVEQVREKTQDQDQDIARRALWVLTAIADKSLLTVPDKNKH